MTWRFVLGEVIVNRRALRRLLDARPGSRLGGDLDARAERVARRARQLVGKDTLTLLRSIRIERGPGYRDIVAGRRGRTPYTMWHHDGTEPHVIRPRRARALRFEIAGRIVFAARVNHPGTRPVKYLTRALPAARG